MIPALYKAAQALYAADTTPTTGLVALLTGGYYTQEGPTTSATPPYVIGSVQASAEMDTFGSDGSMGYFAFNIYTPKVDSLGNAISIGPVADSIIARLRTVFHNQSTTVTFNSITWRVFFKASSGIAIPEDDFAWHHAEVYQVTCFPST